MRALFLVLLCAIAANAAFSRYEYTGNGLGTQLITTNLLPTQIMIVSKDNTTNISLMFWRSTSETVQVGCSNYKPPIGTNNRMDVGWTTGLDSISRQGLNKLGSKFIMHISN